MNENSEDNEKAPLLDVDTQENSLPTVAISNGHQRVGSPPMSPTIYQSTTNATGNGAVISDIDRDSHVILTDFGGDDDDEDADDDSSLLSHCHEKEQSAVDNKKARKTLIMAGALCLVFMLGEVVGGYIAGSLAIMTDAAHLLTDFASFLISLFSLFVASRPATRRMSFGWHRAEVLGAFVSVLLIWIVTGVLVYIAVERIVNKDYEIDATVMLITAACGVAVNILMGTILHGTGHGHSHGGSKSASNAQLNNGKSSHSGAPRNINVRAAFIHVIGDFFQSLGVLIAAYIIYYNPDLAIVDPICTFIFSVLVLITTLAIMRDALNVLMEGSPRGIDFLDVADSLGNLKGVHRVHNLRIWSLTLDKVALSVHLAVGEECNTQEILKTATKMLRRQFGVFECTIQIEHYSNDMEDCSGCEHPKS